MRAYLKTCGGVVMLRGDLLVSPTYLQRALVHGDVVFDTRPDAAADALPDTPARVDEAPAADPAPPPAAEAEAEEPPPAAECEPEEPPRHDPRRGQRSRKR